MIEFTHRITSGLSFFSAVGLLVWTLQAQCADIWRAPRHCARSLSRWLRRFSAHCWSSWGLTAQSQSPLRLRYLALHLTNTLLLLAALTLTAHLLSRERVILRSDIRLVAPFGAGWHHRGADRRRHRIAGSAGRHAVSGYFAGRGAGAGFFRNQRLAGALALDASDDRVSREHLSDLDPGARGAAHAIGTIAALSALVLMLLAAQYVLGVLDVVLLAPVWLQIAHLLGADVLWAALVVLTARLTLEPVEAGNRGVRASEGTRESHCQLEFPSEVLTPGPCSVRPVPCFISPARPLPDRLFPLAVASITGSSGVAVSHSILPSRESPCLRPCRRGCSGSMQRPGC